MSQSPENTPAPPVERALTLAERLRRALGAEHVLTGDACRIYKIQGIAPAVVAIPDTVESVAEALTHAAALEASVIPWSSGSRQSLGYPPQRADLALSLERLNRILAYDPADLTISLQAGVTHAALAAHLADAEQMLPLDAPLPRRATLGGTVATATPGFRRSYYGAPRDLVIGMRVVDATGALIKTGGRVVKNVTGYDLSKLFTGALGALGVIVEINFKLVPQPETEATLLGAFADPVHALNAVEPLSQLALRPSAVVAVQVGALPQLAPLAPHHLDHILLAARFPGVPSAVQRAMREGEIILRAASGRDILPLDAEAHDEFWSALNDFPQTARSQRDGALIRISALPTETGAIVETARALAAEHALRLTWLADAVSGAVWLRIIADTPSSGNDADHRENALVALHETLVHHWRSVVILDCPPQLKPRLALWGTPPPALDLMREVKRSFDPTNRLNPGRFIESL